MHTSRRQFLAQTAACSAAASLSAFPLLGGTASADERSADRCGANDSSKKENGMLIIDTHQHLWNLDQLRLPWLKGAPEVLRHHFGPKEYAQAVAGLNVKAIYMEVDVDTGDHDKEADYVVGLARGGKDHTIAATIGGRPASADFEKYVARHVAGGFVKGVRQVLHNPESPRGACLEPDFVRGVTALGKQGLSFDLCMRPGELLDGLKLSEKCPDTRFVVDHCGNADPKAFDKKLAGDEKPEHEVDPWRRDMEALSKRPNVICKISGIVARAPSGWKPEHLAPIVNHCLDSFGPDRVVFGGDWPVCLLGSPLRNWIEALRQIVSNRSEADQKKLWSENAKKFYRLA
ncbi:MAG: hypothetical protein RIS70_1578 [Planctomycetota bacterium]|jgi:predicted TIM-barrel fold metal-dependent hydrolase